jgi:uncharacterized membrane protein YgcG
MAVWEPEVFDSECNSGATLTFNGKVPLTVGESFQPNDLRIAFVSMIWDVGTYGNGPWGGWTAGWNLLWPVGNPAGSPGFSIFTKKMVAGDSDGRAVSFAPVSQSLTYAACTVRNWNPAATFPVSSTGSLGVPGATGVPSYTAQAGSVSVTAGGILLVHFTSPMDGVATIPSGMTPLADDGQHGGSYNPDPEIAPSYGPSSVLYGQAYAASGSSGTKSVTMVHDATQDVRGEWAAAVFIPGSSDLNMNVGTANETDTANGVTLSRASLTTMNVGTALETDTVFPVINPLWGQHVRDPKFLTGGPVLNSRVQWTTSTPAVGSTVLVETSIDGGATWQMPVNGGPVPGLDRGNTSCTVVLARETLHRVNASDTSPSVPTFDMEIACDDSRDELVSLGVFVLDETDVGECGGNSSSNSSSSGNSGNGVDGAGGDATGGGRSLSFTGVDLSYLISRNTWDDIYFITSGTNYMDAIAQIAQNRFPLVKLNPASTPHTIPTTFILGTQQGNDPWVDIQNLAKAIGCVAYFNAYGFLTVRLYPDVGVDSPVWTFSDGSDGTNPTICQISRAFTDATTYNTVVVSGENSGNEVPFTSTAQITDPNSPLHPNVYDVVTAYFTSAAITSQAMADQCAAALLQAVAGAGDALTLDVVPMPALEIYDPYYAIRPESNINGIYVANGMTIPLGPNGAMEVDGYLISTN